MRASGLRRVAGRVGVVAIAAYGLSLLVSGGAIASSPVVTYSSPACPTGVATWHIAYRMYWASTLGQVTSKSALPAALEQLERFANDVSTDSACGVRAVIDVYDEGAAQWPASAESDQLPADTDEFQTAGRYDWIFYRFPANGEYFCANTSTTGGPAEGTKPSASRFPVDPEGHLGCAAGPTSTDCKCEPWRTLMEHEWLHAAVAFYNPRLGWPVSDVHGACEHGYSPGPCPSGMTNELYFADLMQGKVPEGGFLKGIQPDEWTLQGTPINPLIGIPSILLRRGKQTGKLTVQFPADLGGALRMSIATSSGRVVQESEITTSDSEFSMPGDGRWTICFAFAGSERYYRNTSCFGWASVKIRSCHLNPSKRVQHNWPLRVSRQGHGYRIVAPGIPRGCSSVLEVRHNGHKRALWGRRYSEKVVFKLRASQPGQWKVMLRVSLEDGRRITSREHTLHAVPRLSRSDRPYDLSRTGSDFSWFRKADSM